jgi:hypothetical protein
MQMKPTLEKFQPLIQRLLNGSALTPDDRAACAMALEIAASVKDLDMVAKAEIGILATEILSKE